MRYVKVACDHELEDEPVLYFSELGEDDYETRKVQIYRDGRSEWADESKEDEKVGLSEIAFPPVEDISMQPEFTAEEISADEFESVWRASRSAD